MKYHFCYLERNHPPMSTKMTDFSKYNPIDLDCHKRSKDEQHELICQLIKLAEEGKPIYVTIKDDITREGTIARIGEIGFIYGEHEFTPTTSGYHSYPIREKEVSFNLYGKKVSTDYKWYRGLNVRLAWDKRKNSMEANTYYQLIWLKDYNGPTEYVFKKMADLIEEYEIPDPTDRLGNPIKVDDFVTYIRHTGSSRPVLEFGYISKIEKARSGNSLYNNVFCKKIPLTPKEKVVEAIIAEEDLCIIDDTLKQQLMLRRLQNG